MTAFEIYLLNVISNISAISTVFGFILAIGGGVAFIISHIEDEEKWYKPIKTAIITGCVLLVLSVAIPDRKTMVAMLVVPNISNQQWIKELPDNMQKIVNKLISDYLEEDKK